MITVNLTYNTGGVPSFDTLNAQELMLDGAQYAMNGLNASNVQASQNEPVIKVNDKIGSIHTTFVGGTPPVIGSAPKLVGRALRGENVPGLVYSSSTFTTKPFPYEMGLVVLRKPGQAYEAYENTFNSGKYVGMNETTSRIGANNLTVTGSTIAPLFKKCLIWCLFEATSCTLWIDGVLQGSVSRSSSASVNVKNTIFTDTNNVAHDWFATYHKYSKLSDSDRNTIMSSIMTKWETGIEVQDPYAYNIIESYNSGTQTWSVTFSNKNLSGTGIDSGATQYQWYLNRRATGAPNGNFTDQVLVGTNTTLAKSAYTSYLSGFVGEYYIKCYVQVQDSTGKTFGFTSSEGYAQE